MDSPAQPATFAISYSRYLRGFFTAIGIGPRRSGVTIEGDTVRVRLGWGFSARFPRHTVAAVERYHGRVYGWGAHGWRGRWLVNGSSQGIVVLSLEPQQQGQVLGWPVKLRQLAVSVEDPEGLIRSFG